MSPTNCSLLALLKWFYCSFFVSLTIADTICVAWVWNMPSVTGNSSRVYFWKVFDWNTSAKFSRCYFGIRLSNKKYSLMSWTLNKSIIQNTMSRTTESLRVAKFSLWHITGIAWRVIGISSEDVKGGHCLKSGLLHL